MSRTLQNLVVPALALVVTCASGALAADETDRPIVCDRQTRLLERFGDQGIDADGDGTLTRDEVHAFFADRHPDCTSGKPGKKGCGHHGMKGCGHYGMRGYEYYGMKGDGGGPQDRMCRPLQRLEMLNAETPPAEFDLARFPEADLDGDGQLSDSEWTTFAEQARGRVLARLLAHMPEADADGDGTLNEVELAALKDGLRERVLSKHPDADTDGDGVLSEAEFEAFKASRRQAHRARLLERHPEADLDGDGTLTDEEVHKFKDSQSGPPGAWGGGKHCGDGGKLRCNRARQR